MTRRRIYLLVNGIDNHPGRSKNWNRRGTTWIHINSGYYAESCEYFCTIIGRAFGQNGRAAKLARMISFYSDAGWEIVLVGHSNGTDVILKAMGLLDWPPVKEIHLVSGACEADFELNGLNAALFSGCVEKVFVYVSGKDTALRIAKCRLGRWLGYGGLGLHGPLNVRPTQKEKVSVTTWNDRDHSDCFTDYAFDDTMRLFTHERT